ncbi:MAG TPA: Uma2 family endonuclease [Acidobacteriaceae bacterium]
MSEIELPVRLRFERPLTDDELLHFCAVNDLLRIERDKNGELVLMSPTGAEGGGRNAELTTDLMLWAREDGGGKVFDSNTGFTLPDGSMRSPDASWVSWGKWNGLTREQQKQFAPICPEFVIELRSESDRLDDLRAKMGEWIANGAELAWLIDPERKAVEVYRPGREPEVLEGTSAVYGEGPAGGFVLELGRIWG